MIFLSKIDYSKDGHIRKLLKKYVEIYEEKKRKKDMEDRRKFPLEKRLQENIVGQVNDGNSQAFLRRNDFKNYKS